MFLVIKLDKYFTTMEELRAHGFPHEAQKNSHRCKYFIVSPFPISEAYFPSFMQACIKCSDELKS